MPYVNIKVTGGNEAPSAEQKAELIRGVTEITLTRSQQKSRDDRRRHRRNQYGQLGHRR